MENPHLCPPTYERAVFSLRTRQSRKDRLHGRGACPHMPSRTGSTSKWSITRSAMREVLPVASVTKPGKTRRVTGGSQFRGINGLPIRSTEASSASRLHKPVGPLRDSSPPQCPRTALPEECFLPRKPLRGRQI